MRRTANSWVCGMAHSANQRFAFAKPSRAACSSVESSMPWTTASCALPFS